MPCWFEFVYPNLQVQFPKVSMRFVTLQTNVATFQLLVFRQYRFGACVRVPMSIDLKIQKALSFLWTCSTVDLLFYFAVGEHGRALFARSQYKILRHKGPACFSFMLIFRLVSVWLISHLCILLDTHMLTAPISSCTQRVTDQMKSFPEVWCGRFKISAELKCFIEERCAWDCCFEGQYPGA